MPGPERSPERILLLGACGLMLSCGLRSPHAPTRPEAAPPATVAMQDAPDQPDQPEAPPAPAADAPIATRMQRVESEIQALQRQLERELAQARARTGSGRGAFRDGTYSITGTETVLERLYQTEINLQEAQQALDERTRTIITLRQKSEGQVAEIEELSAKAERLDRAEDRRTTAIQERNAALAGYEELRNRLVASELSRLEIEKTYYDLITEIVRLEPGHTQDFVKLQERLKEDAKATRPIDPIASTDQDHAERTP